jgi:hypothetical protein
MPIAERMPVAWQLLHDDRTYTSTVPDRPRG